MYSSTNWINLSSHPTKKHTHIMIYDIIRVLFPPKSLNWIVILSKSNYLTASWWCVYVSLCRASVVLRKPFTKLSTFNHQYHVLRNIFSFYLLLLLVYLSHSNTSSSTVELWTGALQKWLPWCVFARITKKNVMFNPLIILVQ